MQDRRCRYPEVTVIAWIGRLSTLTPTTMTTRPPSVFFRTSDISDGQNSQRRHTKVKSIILGSFAPPKMPSVGGPWTVEHTVDWGESRCLPKPKRLLQRGRCVSDSCSVRGVVYQIFSRLLVSHNDVLYDEYRLTGTYGVETRRATVAVSCFECPCSSIYRNDPDSQNSALGDGCFNEG